MAGPAQNSLMVGRGPDSNPRIVEVDASGRILEASNSTIIASTAWTIQFQSDLTLNDNNKAITVPAGFVWHILAIRVEYTSDATVGNRQLAVRIRDAANDVMWEVRPDLTQAASLTYLYHFGSSMSDLDAVRDTDWVSTPIPPTLILPGGSDIQVYDNNDVSGNDDIIIHLTIGERTA